MDVPEVVRLLSPSGRRLIPLAPRNPRDLATMQQLVGNFGWVEYHGPGSATVDARPALNGWYLGDDPALPNPKPARSYPQGGKHA